MSRKKYILPKSIIKRAKLAFFSVILIYGFLAYRLMDIQVLKAEEYREKQKNQSTQRVDLNTGRGIIYDRNMKPLTDDLQEDILIVQKDQFVNNVKVRNLVKETTKLSDKEIYKEIESQTNSPVFQIKVQGINKNTKEELLKENIILSKRSIRYKEKNLLSHMIGYTNKTDNTGEYGIERSMNDILDKSNEQYVSVFKVGDAGNKEGLDILKGTIKTVKSNEESRHIKLTIDKRIQSIVENIVDKEKNPTAVLVSDIDTGEILATASRPNFNQNDIASYISEDTSKGELRNRVIQNTYSPGSVFKIVTLYAGLETKNINENYTYNCVGNIKVGKNKEMLNCHKRNGHGVQNLTQAFANSCNTAFFDIARKTGKDNILEYIKKIKLDEKVDIGLKEETSRKVPEDISIRNLAIGQGSMEFTPIQINQMTQIIANNGTYKPLYIYDSVIDSKKDIVKKFETSKEEEIISPYTLTIIKEMMKEVSKTGTAKEMNELEGGCGVKTGTAQTNIDGKAVTHGWITGFYPSESPKYAITVLLEGTKEESKSAIPIFNEICKDINNK